MDVQQKQVTLLFVSFPRTKKSPETPQETTTINNSNHVFRSQQQGTSTSLEA